MMLQEIGAEGQDEKHDDAVCLVLDELGHEESHRLDGYTEADSHREGPELSGPKKD